MTPPPSSRAHPRADPTHCSAPAAPPVGPSLVFEVLKSMAAYSTDGIAPTPGGLKVTVMSAPALELQRSLGAKLFSALFTLICMAGDDGHQLIVDANATQLGEQLGCSRQKAGEMVTQLELAGFLTREQARGVAGRADRFGRGRYVLCPALYRAVERRSTITHSDRLLGDPGTDVTKADSGGFPAGVGKADVRAAAVSEPVIGGERAGRTGGSFSDNGIRSHPHEDEMNEDHSSSLTTDARLTPALIGGVPAEEIVGLLAAWRMVDAERVVAATDPGLLAACLREVEAGVGEKRIPNPGGYLRKLIQTGGPAWFQRSTPPPADARPRPADPPRQTPPPALTADPGHTPSPGQQSAGNKVPAPTVGVPGAGVSTDELLTLLAGLAEDQRTELCRRAGLRAAAGDPLRAELTSVMRRVRLIEELRRDGLL